MDIDAALAACTGQADHYRLQIRVENLLGPADILALEARAGALPRDARIWVHRLAQMTRLLRAEAEPFRRHDLGENVAFYEGHGAGPRSLVVAFTGVGQRMMMPAAPFLQGLPASRCDVVILRDPGMMAFLAGVPGYAADLPALADRLYRDIPSARTAERCSIGTSSGAAAALAFGPLFAAAAAISLGGMLTAAMQLRKAPRGMDRDAFARLSIASSPTPTRLVCAYGQACQRDAVNAALIAMTIPACRLLAVAGVDLHGVIGGLARDGAWRRFVEAFVLGDALPQGGTWQPGLGPAG